MDGERDPREGPLQLLPSNKSPTAGSSSSGALTELLSAAGANRRLPRRLNRASALSPVLQPVPVVRLLRIIC